MSKPPHPRMITLSGVVSTRSGDSTTTQSEASVYSSRQTVCVAPRSLHGLQEN